MGSITNTVTGAPSTFISPAQADIQNLKCYFRPVQTGEGDQSPTNTREISGWNSLTTYTAGKNLASAKQVYGILDTYEEIEKDGKQCVRFRANQTGEYTGIKFKDNTRYTITMDALVEYYPSYNTYASHSIFFKFYYTDGTSSANFHAAPSDGWVHLSTTSQVNKTIRAIGAYSTEYRLRTYIDINTFQIEEGTQATSYEPYRGQTIPITFPIVGKNKFNPNCNWTVGKIYRYFQFTEVETLYSISFTLKDSTIDLSNVSFGFTLYKPTDAAEANKGYYWAIEKGTIKGTKTNVVNYASAGFTDNKGKLCKYLFIYPNTDDAYNKLMDAYDIQIELGSTATTYEPYSSSNTIYGGYVDLITGDVVAEQISKTFTGADATAVTENTNTKLMRFKFGVPLKGNGKTKAGITYSNKLLYSYTSNDLLHYYTTENNANGYVYAYLPLEFSNTDTITFVPSLYTPQIVAKLSPTQLKTFLGKNNYWANTNDTTEVTYDIHETGRIIEEKKKIIIGSGPHIENTTGTIASFETDMKAPIVDLKAHFLPIQTGSGDPSPSNVRSINGWTGLNLNADGRNIMDLQNATWVGNSNKVDKSISGDNVTVIAKTSGRVGFDGSQYSIKQAVPPAWYGKDVYFGCSEVIHNNTDHICTVVIEFRDASNAFITDPTVISTSTNMLYRKITIPSNATTMQIMFRIAQNCGSVDVNVGDYVTFVNFYARFPATTYGYDAFCGRNISIEFPTIKNLLNPKNISHNGYNIGKFPNVLQPNTSYTFSIHGNTQNLYRLYLSTTGLNGTVALNATYINNGTSVKNYKTFTTPADMSDYPYLCLCGNSNGDGNESFENILPQLELGSVETSYEPYGTVYGGYVDLIHGKLVATYGRVDLKKGNWYRYTANQFCINTDRSKTSTNVLCDIMPVSTTGNFAITDKTLGFWSGGQSYARIIFVKYADSDNLQDFKDWINSLEGNPYIVYELATPIEYQLTPQQIIAFKGTNNIWSDANGTVDIKYWTH